MWGRVIEIMLAVWLSLSPFLFGHYPEERALWISDLLCAGTIMLLSCLAFYKPLRRAHLGNMLVAGWLIGFGYFYGGYPAAAGYQNDILTGLTLLLFAIVPNQANQPPRDWQQFYQKVAATQIK